VLLSITVVRHQVADVNPEKGSDETFTISLLNVNGKEEFARELLGCQITAKCDEDGIYWKNADKLQFRFRFLHSLSIFCLAVAL